MAEKPLDPSLPVRAAHGRRVEILKADVKNQQFQIVAVHAEPNGTEVVICHRRDGTSSWASGEYDLSNCPRQRTVWLNVYLGSTSLHYSAEVAERHAGQDCIKAAVPVIVEY